VAARRSPRSRHHLLVGGPRCRRGPAERHDRDHRPSRITQRHRGKPGRHQGGVRDGRGAHQPLLRRDGPVERGPHVIEGRPVLRDDRRGAARSGGEREVPARWRQGHGGRACSIHLQRRDSRARCRTGCGPRNRCAHPRCRGTRRRRCGASSRASRHRRLVARALRPSRQAPARDDRPQPPLQHEQLGGLRAAGAAREHRGARHRRHRGRHAGGGPSRVRQIARDRHHGDTRHCVDMVGERRVILPRGRGRHGRVVLRPCRQCVARGVHAGCARHQRDGRRTSRRPERRTRSFRPAGNPLEGCRGCLTTPFPIVGPSCPY